LDKLFEDERKGEELLKTEHERQLKDTYCYDKMVVNLNLAPHKDRNDNQQDPSYLPLAGNDNDRFLKLKLLFAISCCNANN
jgi:hypothetical protein